MTGTIASDHLALSAHLSPVMARYFQRAWSHGEGHHLFDTDGRRYLDFACGIATTVLGHGHPRVNAAIHAQVDRLVTRATGSATSTRSVGSPRSSPTRCPLLSTPSSSGTREPR